MLSLGQLTCVHFHLLTWLEKSCALHGVEVLAAISIKKFSKCPNWKVIECCQKYTNYSPELYKMGADETDVDRSAASPSRADSSPTPEAPTDTGSRGPIVYVLYWQRWFILTVFSLLACHQVHSEGNSRKRRITLFLFFPSSASCGIPTVRSTRQ